MLDGKQDIADGKFEQGLSKLEQASSQSPQNVEYRSELFRQRGVVLAQLLGNAEVARANNDMEQAETFYRRVLKIEPGNERAKAGIEAIAMEQRHRILVTEAEALFKKGNYRDAERSICMVVTCPEPEAARSTCTSTTH